MIKLYQEVCFLILSTQINGVAIFYWLPIPRLTISIDIEAIFKALQDIRFIGVLRQRWEEIKRLQLNILQPT
ncbi:hypothetical protein B6D29_04645 [Microgenomates bacterium UTCPR1]|nr:MAG: hypothetical protein B6D29_04645 [Microgenomates bacterium UTCPR1]